MDQYTEVAISIYIFKIVPPILLVFGTFGNIFTIYLLQRRQFRNKSTPLFLTSLAVFDLTVLWAAIVRNWVTPVFGYDVTSSSGFACKIIYFLLYFPTHCSSWMVVAVTVERVICVLFPTKVKLIFTENTTKIIILAVTLSLFLLNIHFLILFNVTDEGTCYPHNNDYMMFISSVWPTLDLCVLCLVPAAVIIAGNTAILVRLLMRRWSNRSRVAPQSRNENQGASSNSSRITITIISVNVMFFICLTPITIFLIKYPFWALESHGTSKEEAILELVWTLSIMLMTFNYAVNFVLYCFCGRRFRDEAKLCLNQLLVKLFKCCRQPNAVVPQNVPTLRTTPSQRGS